MTYLEKEIIRTARRFINAHKGEKTTHAEAWFELRKAVEDYEKDLKS